MRNGIDLHGYQVEWNEREKGLIGATATDGTRMRWDGIELASQQTEINWDYSSWTTQNEGREGQDRSSEQSNMTKSDSVHWRCQS